MKKENKKTLVASTVLFALFVLWTILVKFIDIKPIGPMGTSVGFATINSYFHNLTGTNWIMYNITDWLGIVPIIFVIGFALLGVFQLIKRKSIFKVDNNIIILGIFYVIILVSFILFEKFVINYRPVLINGVLEASYPSSTTLLIMCVIPTAIMQLKSRIKNCVLKNLVTLLLVAFICFMVIGRLISGVHWFSDIVGGALLSSAFVSMYYFLTN